jgi:hypothetical protein
MSLADIVSAIDAYLLRLEQARDLLMGSTVAGRSGSRRRATSTTSARQSQRSEQDAGARTRKATKSSLQASSGPVKPAAAPRTVPAPTLAHPSPAPGVTRPAPTPVVGRPAPAPGGMQPAQATGADQIPVTVEVKKLRAAGPQRRRFSLRTATPKAKPAEPQSALGGAVPTGWVGVSADEARRAREQHVVRPAAPVHFEAPATAPAGRQAFEAIFGGGTEVAEDSKDLRNEE